jgi:XTP/dITP diphosphohydrolase
MMAANVLLATRSEGKLRELRPLFERAGIIVADLRDASLSPSTDENLVEAFDTFEANALAKARYFHALTGRPTIADDSGLEVDALAGQPGVRSKRWSGRTDLAGQALDDANNARLLDSLREMRERRARYVCAAAYCDGTREEVTRGETGGIIVHDARGEHGFGYDPYFFSVELGATFGESSREAKERVSHRGRAFRALLERLPQG